MQTHRKCSGRKKSAILRTSRPLVRHAPFLGSSTTRLIPFLPPVTNLELILVNVQQSFQTSSSKAAYWEQRYSTLYSAYQRLDQMYRQLAPSHHQPIHVPRESPIFMHPSSISPQQASFGYGLQRRPITRLDVGSFLGAPDQRQSNATSVSTLTPDIRFSPTPPEQGVTSVPSTPQCVVDTPSPCSIAASTVTVIRTQAFGSSQGRNTRS